MITVRSDIRIGHVKVDGPVSKNQYLITPQGTPVEDEDIDILENEYPIYCHAEKCFKMKKALFLVED